MAYDAARVRAADLSDAPTERGEIDPYAELPEGLELELFDPDDPAGDAASAAFGDSAAGLDADEEDLSFTRSAADIVVWPVGFGLEWEVPTALRLAQRGRLDDPDHFAWATFLETVTAAMVDRQPEALRARGLVEAFDGLRPLSQKGLGEAVGYDEAQVSRANDVLVATPHWTAPLHFFAWKGRDQQRTADRLRAVATELARDPTATNAAVSRRVRSTAGGSADTLRKDAAQIRHVAAAVKTIERCRARRPLLPWEDLRDEAGLEKERGALLAKLVLIGGVALPSGT